ncbi:MAG: gamma-glutamyltransferase [Acidobacteria bacterium]|nr:gamma-glutamyltransferase [Acidobacteriota bacterium]MSO83972.1 gamma-glutamyltransferase [Acidobacteriota bacterium]
MCFREMHLVYIARLEVTVMRRLGLICTLVLVAIVSTPQAQTSTWRPVVLSDTGMVASGHALASEAGIRILKSGGNAVDAAVAAWAVQGLTEPEMTGIGGDLFMLIYLAKTGEVKFINGTGVAPMAATVDFYKGKGGLPQDGILSVSVPGAVAGAELAANTYGTKPMSELMAPAVELAERGFPITESLAGAIRGSRDKLSPSAKAVWFNGNEPLGMGDRVVQKDLGATLREIGAKGSAAFYQGPVAEKFAAYMKAQGGLIDRQDLAAIKANEDTPIHINYKGVEVYECPPNSQGFVMLQALNILEGMNVRYLRHNSAPYLHAVTESLKLAFADRNKYVADPKFTPNIPMREMLSKEYAAIRRRLIDPDQAIAGEAPAGNPRQPATSVQQALAYASPQASPDGATVLQGVEDGHTTYLAVIDKDRNMVSVTSSLLSLFGSGHLVQGAGFMLNNRMAYYGLDEDDVNVLRPGKRVRQTINPALALKDGKPYMVFGTPGADTQPQAQLQFFLNVAEFGMNVQQALEQSYVVSTSFKSSTYPHPAEGKLQVPASLPKHVLDELAAMGHQLDLRNVRGVGSVKAIVIHPKTGVLMGGVSPTRDSYVMAY